MNILQIVINFLGEFFMNRKMLSLLLLPLALSACGNFGEANKSSTNSKTQSKVNSVAVSEKISSYKQSSKEDKESELEDSSIYEEVANMKVDISSISMSSIKAPISSASSSATKKNNSTSNYSNATTIKSSQSTSSSSYTINSPQQAMALAESKYGNNNGDWEWTYLTDGTNDTSSFFVKAISKSQLANGSMTGTALSLTVYSDGTIVKN